MKAADESGRAVTDGLASSDQGRRLNGWRVWCATRATRISISFAWLLRTVTLFKEAVPVGLLRRPEIDGLVWEAYYGAPDFYDPHRYAIRSEEVLIPVLERLTRGRRLLDLYCGQGREAKIFAEAGYQVLGVECQPEAVERARAYAEQSGFSAEFVQADVGTWMPTQQGWDVVYTSLWMYSTIPDQAVRVEWLRRLAGWMGSEGLLVISVTPRLPGNGPVFRHLCARVLAWLSRNERRPELGDRFHWKLFWHDFNEAEVRAELADAGLSVIETLQMHSKPPCIAYILRRLQG